MTVEVLPAKLPARADQIHRGTVERCPPKGGSGRQRGVAPDHPPTALPAPLTASAPTGRSWPAPTRRPLTHVNISSRITANPPPKLGETGSQKGKVAMMTIGDRIAQQRYMQLDLHDLARVALRWRMLLEGNKRIGFTESEVALREAVASVLVRVRMDAIGLYRITGD